MTFIIIRSLSSPCYGRRWFPDDWLQPYPTITTAFLLSLIQLLCPPSSLPVPVEPLSDITQTVFDASGLAPVAVALGLLGVIACLI